MTTKPKYTQIKTVPLVILCLIVFGIGYFMVEFLSTGERPLLGMTFHIVIGCLLMSIATIVLVITLKRHFFPKKKRKGKRPIFLDEDKRKTKQTRDI